MLGSKEISVMSRKNPRYYFEMIKKEFVRFTSISLVALEGATVIAIDSALLLSRENIAQIIAIRTSYVKVFCWRFFHILLQLNI